MVMVHLKDGVEIDCDEAANKAKKRLKERMLHIIDCQRAGENVDCETYILSEFTDSQLRTIKVFISSFD